VLCAVASAASWPDRPRRSFVRPFLRKFPVSFPPTCVARLCKTQLFDCVDQESEYLGTECHYYWIIGTRVYHFFFGTNGTHHYMVLEYHGSTYMCTSHGTIGTIGKVVNEYSSTVIGMAIHVYKYLINNIISCARTREYVHVYDAGAGARAGPHACVEIRAADIAVELEPQL
jgi:hypothetical protein